MPSRISKPKDVYVNTSNHSKQKKTVTINTHKPILKNVSRGDKVVINTNTSVRNKNNKEVVNLVNNAFMGNNNIDDDFEMEYFNNNINNNNNNNDNINDNTYDNQKKEESGNNGIGFFDILANIGSSLTRPIFNHIENTINHNKEQYIINDNNVTTKIRQTDIDTILENIKSIKRYLKICLSMLDNNISMIVKAQKYINTLTKSCNNYKVYSSLTFKIYELLKRMDKTCKTSNYNNLPLFYIKKTGVRSVKSIRFPLFTTDNNTVNTLIMNKLKCSEQHFKIPLMKATLKCLDLEKYSYPILHTNDKMTRNTNCIPHYSCRIGKKPDRKLYTESYMIKCWTSKYHINQFQKAVDKLQIVKQETNNILSKLEYMDNVCYNL